MKVFMKSGAWSHFYSLRFVAVIYQEVNRGFEKCIMIHRDSRLPTCTAFSNPSKKETRPIFVWNVPARQPFCAQSLFCITHGCRHSDEFFARDASRKGFVVKLLFPIASFTAYSAGGTRWSSWLRHCATIRKVAGSIPDGVTGAFH